MYARPAEEHAAGYGAGNRTTPAGLGAGAWNWRPADESLTWSDGVRALLQLPPEQPASWACWLKQVHPDDRDMVRRSCLPPVPYGKPDHRFEYRLIRSDGSEIRIEDRRQMDADGTCQGVFTDVTPREKSSPLTFDSGNCAGRVMKAAGIGVFFRDFETGQSYWNDTLYDICGLDGSAPPPNLEQLLLQVIHPEDAERVKRHVEDCGMSEGSLEIDFRIVRPSGEERWLRERGSCWKGADGRVLSYCGALQDVTDEKRRAAQLEESRRLLELALEEASVREITMQRFEALGYAVEEAADAASALHAVRSAGAFDLVLSDISMPGPMNGLALRDRLASEMPALPVVLITAHEDLAGGTGRRQILSKSCSQAELAQALAAALSRRGKAAQEGELDTGTAST